MLKWLKSKLIYKLCWNYWWSVNLVEDKEGNMLPRSGKSLQWS